MGGLKFKSLTRLFKDVAHQKATLAQNHKWSDIEDLPKPDKLFKTWKAISKTWKAISDTYINMKKYAFGVLTIFGFMHFCPDIAPTSCQQSCVKIKVTSYDADIDKISCAVQKQKSH